ncbi:MAG: exosortase [Candidatus Acidiferrum sp.]
MKSITTTSQNVRLDRISIVWSLISLALLFLLYSQVLHALILDWWTDPDYGYGFFVPLFSAYILWTQRHRWSQIEIKPSNFGLVVILTSVSLLFLATLGAELFTTRFSLLLLLTGLILFLAGWKWLRGVSFALAFLALMIPIPVIIYNQVTFPLQLLASRLASSLLELVGVPVLRDGNVLVLSNYSLEVAEACSGIRSFMSLIALAIAYGYLAEPRILLRCILVVLIIPIAIATNAIRITAAGVLARHFGSAAAQGFLHEFSGWLTFLLALFLVFVSHWILLRFIRSRQPAHA